MRIAQINMVTHSSTGKIMLQIAECGREAGHEMYTFSVPGFSIRHPEKLVHFENHKYLGTRIEHAVHYVLGKKFGRLGYFSHFATLKLISDFKKIKPDIIHIHNIHNWCLNFPLLFSYLKRCGAKIVWTLHDCWSFTGQCPCFDMAGCDKWKTGCYNCPQCDVYPQTDIDRSAKMYEKKKEWFLGVPNMALVTPSKWLADLVKQSFMGEYPVKVIPNGIDLSVFSPRSSSFKKIYGCEGKTVLLGVAFDWGERKGLDVFSQLAKRFDDCFKIVLVGIPNELAANMPDNIICIGKTKSQEELAEIYSAADIFVNPTREDNFPTVNMEALACGTPVITFNTGGCPEVVDSSCGIVVPRNDIDALCEKILYVAENKPFDKASCIKRAEQFDKNDRFKEYLDFYGELLIERGVENEKGR